MSQGGKSSGGAVKPPLYIPGRREPSNNNRRSIDRRPQQAVMGGAGTDGYASKTGFSSLTLGAQPPAQRHAAGSTTEAGDKGQIPYE